MINGLKKIRSELDQLKKLKDSKDPLIQKMVGLKEKAVEAKAAPVETFKPQIMVDPPMHESKPKMVKAEPEQMMIL